MRIENLPIPFWHLLSIKQLDTSRELDQRDRAEFGAWLIGCLLATGMMAVNDFDGFKLGRFRLQSMAGIALTCIAVHVTDKATRKYAEMYGVTYRNEYQRNMDEAVTETTVFYQHQTAQLQAQWQQYVAQLNAQHDSEIDAMMNESSGQVRALKTQHQEAIQNLQYQISDYVTDIEVLEERVSNLKAQKFHEQEQVRCDVEEAREYLENDRRAIQQQREELALSEQRLEAREHQMKHEANQIWQEERDRLQAEQQRLDEYQAQLDAIEEQYRQQAMQMAQEAVMTEIEGKNQEIEDLKENLNMMAEMVEQLRIPTFIEGSTRAALLANEVIRALKELNIVLLETGVWNEAGNSDILIIQGKISPANPDSSLANYCTVLGHVVPFLNKTENLGFIQGAIADCNATPKIRSVSGNKLELVLDVSGVDRDAIKRQQVEAEQFEANYFVPDSGDKDILHMVQHNFHIGVQGESGAGKTTLLDEIIHAVVGVMGDDVEIKYGSTKPDPKSTTLHLVTANDTQTYLEFLLDAFVNVEYRLLMNRRYADEVKHLHPDARPPKPTFPPLFYLADEINDSLNDIADLTELDLQDAWATLADRYSGNESILGIIAHQSERMAVKTVGPKCLKKVWNLGRSEHVKFVYFGQDLMPKGLDHTGTIKRNNVYNNAMIAIGDKSIELAIEFMVKAPSERERILEEYNRMKNAIGDEVINRFQGLFVSKGDDPCVYFAQLPAPGTYRSSIIMNQLQEPGTTAQTSINEDLQSLGTSGNGSDGNFRSFTEVLGTSENQPENQVQLPLSNSRQILQTLCTSERGVENGSNSQDFRYNCAVQLPTKQEPSVSDRTQVYQSYRLLGSMTKVIEELWGITNRRSNEYKFAKWLFRQIVMGQYRETIPRLKAFGEEVSDGWNFSEAKIRILNGGK